jgi:5-methylcytosine-specific restriction endonuclease McrA
MKLTKAQRAALREKFGGRCAYCGQPLGDKWHADHIEPVERKMKYVSGIGLVSTGEMHRPHRDTVENMNPACPPCNIDKHSMTLEDWRGMIARSNDVLTRDVSTFRRAVRYGLVTLAPKPVVFYCETLEAAA